MSLRDDGDARPQGAAEAQLSPAELGQILRLERRRQGLSAPDAAARFGLPEANLDALESGNVEEVADRMELLQAMRRYADGLGLPGDRYVLTLIESWPRENVPVASPASDPLTGVVSPVGAAPVGAGVPGVYTTGPVPVVSNTGVYPAVGGPGPAPAGGALATPRTRPPTPVPAPAPTTAVTTGAADAAALNPSGAVPTTERSGKRPGRRRNDPPVPVYSLSRGPAQRTNPPIVPATDIIGPPSGGTIVVPLGTFASGHDPGTAQVPRFHDTGVTPAVGRGAVGPVHSSLVLRLLLVLLLVALLTGVAGLVIQHVKPQWLRDVGITSKTVPTVSTTTVSTTTVSTTTTTTAAQTTTDGGRGTTRGSLTYITTSSASSTIDVKASSISVGVGAVGALCWIEVTSPQSISPLFAGDLKPSQIKGFNVQQSITIEIGSAAGHLFVAKGSKILGTFIPPVAPYTVTIRALG